MDRVRVGVLGGSGGGSSLPPELELPLLVVRMKGDFETGSISARDWKTFD